MGFFDLILSNSGVSFEKELPNKDLLYISFERNIPNVRKGFHISITLDSKGNIEFLNHSTEIPDPSTIYFHLPISDDVDIPKLPYWPNYIELTSGQRSKYLNWLRNVEQPIEMGYVFLYYYGLERQLLIGNFDKAYDEIIKLRRVHKNKSFLKYSENGLVHSALIHDRLDRLIDLHEKTEISGYSNSMFLLAYNGGMALGVDQLILIFNKAFTISRKVIKENKHLFVECLINLLNHRFGSDSFSIKQYDISNVKTVLETRFANYSFPKEIQQVEITDFYQCENLMTDLKIMFDGAYEIYRSRISALKSNKSQEDKLHIPPSKK